MKNSFDQDKVQSKLNLQITVSQDFSKNVQQANTEINQHLDDLKDQLDKGEISQTDYDEQVSNWQKGQVLLNAIASGLAAPTQSGAGIAAATASPAISYEIGQYFKDLASQNEDGTLTNSQETAHILAHAVLGAAVSAAGNNSALSGAISAGGAEAAAPIISHYLYGEQDGSKLTAEQKETVVAITSLLGTTVGAVTGNTAANAVSGSLNAGNAVGNNWLSIAEIQEFQRQKESLALLENDEDYEKALRELYEQTAIKSQVNRERTTQNCQNADSVACQQDIENMLNGLAYFTDANLYNAYSESEAHKLMHDDENALSEADSLYDSSDITSVELPTVSVYAKRIPYHDRKDIRFFEYENLRDIANFASNAEKRAQIEAYLGSKDYQYTTQPWYDKPYGSMYIMPTLQGTLGVVQAGGGALLCETGIGCVIGGLLVGTGLDDVQTGMRNFGIEPAKQNETLRVQGLQALGMDKDTAQWTALIGDLALGGAGALKAINAGTKFTVTGAADISNLNKTAGEALAAKYTYNSETGLYKGPNGGQAQMIGRDDIGNPIMQRVNADGTLQNSYYKIDNGKQVAVSNPNPKPSVTSISDLHRPTLRKEISDSIYGDYVKLPNGDYLGINDNLIKGPVHIGHRYGWENRRLLKAADELGMTQKQLNDYVNDPRRAKQLFELQNGAENMGHRFEKPGIDDLDKIKRDMRNFLNGK